MNNKVKFKGPMKHFMRWPLYLSVLVVLLDLLVFIVSVKAGILVSVGTVIYIFIAVQLFRYHKPLIINDMIAFANQYDVVEKRMLEELALPYAIMDMEGRMIWSNRIFSEITGRDQFYKKNISTVFPDITPDKLPVADELEISEMSTHFGDRIYRVSMQRVTMGEVVSHADILEDMSQNVSLIAMYLYDETELKEYIQKNEDNKLVVALAYLDNYEEALESVEDVRRSLLIALIDRKITKYFSNFDGLVKKLEKDKYLLIMRQSSLETLKEQRFHILDEVKTVNIGNEMAVTLSIGIGLNASTYIQNYEYARIAIEMALGRGGDQVVIKNGNNITYIGGKAQQMEKSTRVKARVKAQALKEFMSTKDRVVVMGHKITDVDALGAGIGIYRAGKTLGKPVHIVINDPTTSIRPLMSGFKENPDYENIVFTVKAEDKDSLEKVGTEILTCPAALSISYTSSLSAQVDRMLSTLDVVILVLIVSAGMLAFVVLYNLNNINITERQRELATLKVLGFYDGEVSQYVLRENVILTALGIVFGSIFGILLHRYVITTVEVDAVMFGRNIKPMSFVYGGILTSVFSAVVNAVMHFKLKTINMVESLKSVE